ncbi:hypothetical protein [Maridesulfovibrio frigidus]|nr:hypothetical protein [Maridesulfovibrio frigidus]
MNKHSDSTSRKEVLLEDRGNPPVKKTPPRPQVPTPKPEKKK